MKLVSGRIENFKKYSQFKSLKDFNNDIEMFLAIHKKDFTKGELIAFKRLTKFSAKFFGVANARICKLLKAINEKAGGFGVSRSTFERMLIKAKELGILTVKNTVKSKGGKGHNVYVFNTIDALKERKLTHCENDETQTESKDEQGNFEGEAFNLLETSNKKQESNIYKGDNKIVQYVVNKINDAIKEGSKITYLSSYVDKTFRSLEQQALRDANNRAIAKIKKREEDAREFFNSIKPVSKYNWLEN